MADETLLGFDFGVKRIGVAVGQTVTGTASALTVLPAKRQAPDWLGIEKLIKEWQPNALVVGLCLDRYGQDNEVTPRIRKFCRQLNGRYQLPVYQHDETLSTFEAKQLLFDDVNVSARKLMAVQDALAAQRILESWLAEH
ncbi:MAG: Holliday junction resolvase RuvX [Methylococcales bacterium]|nr:Holliday junction resolvase RuvX [Methylococcales bacterium]